MKDIIRELPSGASLPVKNAGGIGWRHRMARSRNVGIGMRLLGAVGGGYALTALSVASAGTVMARLGMARSEAVVLAAMLGFVVYLTLLLWAFSVSSVTRLWMGMAAGATAMAVVLLIVR
ncbi:MAG: hypothetical protein ABWY27_20125 [Telluria sp.]